MIATLSLGFAFDRAAAFFRTYMGSLKSSTNHEAILFFLAAKTGGWVEPSPVAVTATSLAATGDGLTAEQTRREVEPASLAVIFDGIIAPHLYTVDPF